ncbi:MAG TPA: hypothetical protein VGA66_12235, partial [Mycobacterium sp.]
MRVHAWDWRRFRQIQSRPLSVLEVPAYERKIRSQRQFRSEAGNAAVSLTVGPGQRAWSWIVVPLTRSCAFRVLGITTMSAPASTNTAVVVTTIKIIALVAMSDYPSRLCHIVGISSYG